MFILTWGITSVFLFHCINNHFQLCHGFFYQQVSWWQRMNRLLWSLLLPAEWSKKWHYPNKATHTVNHFYILTVGKVTVPRRWSHNRRNKKEMLKWEWKRIWIRGASSKHQNHRVGINKKIENRKSQYSLKLQILPVRQLELKQKITKVIIIKKIMMADTP